MNNLITWADLQDQSKGKRLWAINCEIHQKREIEELINKNKPLKS